MKQSFFLPIIGLFLAFNVFAPAAVGAENAYLELEANGEVIEGEPSRPEIGGMDVSTQIECLAFNHEVFRATGGQAVQGPVKIVKVVDKSSPLLYQALSQNQNITATFNFFQRDRDLGSIENHYRIELANARISGIRHWFPNRLDPASITYPQMEEISFTYQTITITHLNSGTTTVMSLTPP